MTVAITASPGFPRVEWAQAYVRSLQPGTIVASPHGSPVDQEVERLAWRHGLPAYIFPPASSAERDTERLLQLVDVADRVLVYWDGTSDDALKVIRLARAAKKPLAVIGLDGRKMRVAGLEIDPVA